MLTSTINHSSLVPAWNPPTKLPPIQDAIQWVGSDILQILDSATSNVIYKLLPEDAGQLADNLARQLPNTSWEDLKDSKNSSSTPMQSDNTPQTIQTTYKGVHICLKFCLEYKGDEKKEIRIPGHENTQIDLVLESDCTFPQLEKWLKSYSCKWGHSVSENAQQPPTVATQKRTIAYRNESQTRGAPPPPLLVVHVYNQQQQQQQSPIPLSKLQPVQCEGKHITPDPSDVGPHAGQQTGQSSLKTPLSPNSTMPVLQMPRCDKEDRIYFIAFAFADLVKHGQIVGDPENRENFATRNGVPPDQFKQLIQNNGTLTDAGLNAHRIMDPNNIKTREILRYNGFEWGNSLSENAQQPPTVATQKRTIADGKRHRTGWAKQRYSHQQQQPPMGLYIPQPAQYWGNQPVQYWDNQPAQYWGNQPVQYWDNQPAQYWGNQPAQYWGKHITPDPSDVGPHAGQQTGQSSLKTPLSPNSTMPVLQMPRCDKEDRIYFIAFAFADLVYHNQIDANITNMRDLAIRNQVQVRDIKLYTNQNGTLTNLGLVTRQQYDPTGIKTAKILQDAGFEYKPIPEQYFCPAQSNPKPFAQPSS